MFLVFGTPEKSTEQLPSFVVVAVVCKEIANSALGVNREDALFGNKMEFIFGIKDVGDILFGVSCFECPVGSWVLLGGLYL